MADSGEVQEAEPLGAEASIDREVEAAEARLVRGVRWRLVAWSGGTTLLVLLALGIALYATVADSLADAGTRVLDARATEMRHFLERDGHEPEAPTGFIFGGGSSGTFALLIDRDDRALGPRELRVPEGLPDGDAVAEARSSGFDVRTGTVAGVSIRILSERIDTRIGPLVVQVIGDRTAEMQTLNVLVAVLIGGGLVAVLVAAGVGALYAQRALVPIRASLASQRAALRRQRDFAADASHELRTPLTVIRGSVELLRRAARPSAAGAERIPSAGAESLDDIEAEVIHLTALVDDLLLLARSDSGAVTLARQPVDLGVIVDEAAASLQGQASARGVKLVVEAATTNVVGDPVRLRQLVVILLDNAIRHSPAGGDVSVAVVAADRAAVLSVDDDGPGLRPEDLPKVFDRFWRAPGAPSGGTGLGLAIATWIVRGHDGELEATNRPEGGARFMVRFPAARH
jgi:signal transduction histidine kinase